MTANKLTYASLVLALSVASPAAPNPPDAPTDLPEPAVLVINGTQRTFLSQVARRTLRDAVLGREPYEPGYVPEALASSNAEVIVRIRRHGFLLAAITAGPDPLAVATRDAALTAAESLVTGASADLDFANRALVEIEVVGPSQPLPVQTDWTRPRVLDPFIEPGVHGLTLVGPRIQHRLCPTELYTSDRVLADAMEWLAQMTHKDPSQLAKVRLLRFRTNHWYEPHSSADIVSLHRGLTVIPDEAITANRMDDAIAVLADYMAYRQLDTGLFTYQYEPGKDRYSDEQNLVRQVGAVVAMSHHATYSRSQASLAAADAGITYHLQGLVDIPSIQEAAFIATGDGRHKLGVTALLCLAMAQHPDEQQYTALRTKLVNGMLWLQSPSGMFATAFPPAVRIDSQDYFPGEALLALATDYAHKPSARVLDAFHRAITFYRDYFRGRPSPAFVPWQVQAYTTMALQTKRTDYAQYVFELTDWLADMQLTPASCAWPEMWGGIASYAPGRAGVATAAYLEGFADALKLARSVGDTERAARYEKVVRQAARFVIQLQVRPEEAYFVRSPQDAVGGIRTSPSLNLLRIDHCQHALVGLMKARQVLFPDGD